MDMTGRRFRRMLIPFLAAALMGIESPAEEGTERGLLEQRAEQLASRITALRQEQELLMFQAAFSASDSKYLLLDLSSGHGSLRYRNRLLRSFTLQTHSASRSGRIPKGPYALATKKEDKAGRKALVFADAFIISSKQPPRMSGAEANVPRIIIRKSDLSAIYYAVEQGSRVYIVR